ncbi:FAD-binding oxidoreductase [Pontivivens insulae]|uniref:D-lactate dehydrogenase (cytochrome) n=1 Tax=Pontivivens insulae TaxID=1639689 RepID=A0A2R8ADB9_9RHOB|nr:FAD-linked oxidase C-terminal domain-containing protein [Pontivivens insulae]RED14155.1 D-lactate dehydrogenase (cytochrome) [Pontivivens insulae]SPF30231.1 putative FAD-linked oxidoreductase [Pontivivens insulae]
MTIETALEALAKQFGDRVQTGHSARVLHGGNESYFDEVLPDAVLAPRSTEEVSRIVRICAEHGCPIIPWGVGTSLEGHALALSGGISLDMGEMTKVIEINAEDMDVRVQPGCTREALNTELRATGLFFPVDPGANATLGGMAATRASGTTAVRYGTMRENVMALEVVLADGRIIRTGSRARKSSAGYDLTKLMIGSEGTLGIITELTLRLHGQPEAAASAICAFPDIESAVGAVQTTMQMGVPMARIEFLDAACIRAVNRADNRALPETPHLFMEFHGSEAAVAEQAESVREITAEFGGSAFDWSTDHAERARLWHARHNAYYSVKALRAGCQAVTTDVCVPISRLAEAVTETTADIEASPLLGPILGHVGDGNFHAALLIEPGNSGELAEAKRLAHQMAERALRLGGTVTGEHGVGVGKMKYMTQEHGDAWQVMATLKQALDPQNILNPGKVVAVN